MRTISLQPVLIVLALLITGMSARADTYTFSLDPLSGNIQGPDGSTIGWGYSITNDSGTDWLVTTNLSAGIFSDASPDASPFDFPIIAPLSTVSLPFDPSTDTGLFALNWDAGAPVGFVNSGVFTLSADWYTGDPLAGGNFDQHASDETAAYSATVSASSGPAPVPEPGTLKLIIVVLVMLRLLINPKVWRRFRQTKCNMQRLVTG
ncbi:MAG: hypothetical protein WBW33_05910 [Bryobacteraceae bacterium]